ncbi:HdeD family acid-resistance protein [Trebonia sp.]|uniref:HdeD family acid-resistance protein n=1 Tax=Trebonia sp. TaxID=2767075 RepID=UPI00260F221D|nr:HdeD family acid-resistance protein [Trebonia sp.]
MHDDDYSDQPAPAMLVATSTWQATLFIGVVTLILGFIVTFHPSGSLNVIAVLIGVLAIVSGIFQLIRTFDRTERHRAWLGICGLLFVVIGVVLIRHLHLTVAAIGLLVGITWIVQGVAGLIGAFAGAREGAFWWGLFGAISLIAGIVVTAAPVTSVTVLAVLIGIWFIIMGLFEIVAAFIIRHALSAERGQSAGPLAGPPAPRSSDEGASSQEPGRPRRSPA